MTDVLDAPTSPLGQPIKRTEDPRFITGKGRYLDDIQLQGMVHIAILRSPYAHANIASIDTSRAKKAPGVLRRRSELLLLNRTRPAEPGAAGREKTSGRVSIELTAARRVGEKTP